MICAAIMVHVILVSVPAEEYIGVQKGIPRDIVQYSSTASLVLPEKGEFDMRSFGIVFLLLLLSLIGFGFLASYSYQLYQRMEVKDAQLESLQADLDAMEAQYQAAIAERDRLSQQNSDLNAQNLDLLNQLRALKTERETLLGQIKTLQMRVTLIEKTNSLLGWLEPRSARYLVALLAVPLIPVSWRAFHVMTRHNDPRPTAALPKEAAHCPNMFLAALTRDEFHLLAQYRRSRHMHPASIKSTLAAKALIAPLPGPVE
jgi:cell division protein FtsB